MAVYFFQEQGGERLIKIGKANDVATRLLHVRSQSEHDLKVLGYIDGDEREEKLLHAVFAEYRQHGEWFRPCELLVGFIDRNTKQLKRVPKRLRPRRAGWQVRPETIARFARWKEEQGL